MTVTARTATKSEAAGGSGGCSLVTGMYREQILHSLSLPAARLVLTPRLLFSRLLFKELSLLFCSVLFNVFQVPEPQGQAEPCECEVSDQTLVSAVFTVVCDRRSAGCTASSLRRLHLVL